MDAIENVSSHNIQYSDWEILKLGDLCEFTQGVQIPQEQQKRVSEDGYIRYLYIRDFFDDDFKWFVKNEYPNKVMNEDDIMMVNTGNTAGMVYSGAHGVLSNNAFKISFDKKRVLREFLLFFFTYSDTQLRIKSLFNSGGQPHVGHKNVAQIKIPLPPLPEQKTISEVLNKSDIAIHKAEKLIAQKELRKKWLMQKLLLGKIRLKGFTDEWKERKLSDLFERVIRKNDEGNLNVVTISAQRGFVRQTDFFNKKIASEITDNYFLVEKGEFCYNKSYSNGYPWGAIKKLNDFDKAVVTTLYICFRVKNEMEVNPEFFEQYFGANYLDKGLAKIANEGGRAHGLLNVTPSDFFSLKITVPSYDEQTSIAKVLITADKEIYLLKSKAAKMREQKKGLMQVLLTGKVRLKIN